MQRTDFRIKLIYPSELYKVNLGKNPHIDSREPVYLPYGMGILTASLRQQGFYVEQEDLSIKFKPYYNKVYNRGLNRVDLYNHTIEKEVRAFLTGSLKNNKLSLFLDEILDYLPMSVFDLIGFSITTDSQFIFSLLLAKRIKERTGTPIVFGGPFIILYGQLYPKIFNYMDYMVVGDGSIPLVKLIDCLQKKVGASDVPNLIYKNNGNLTVSLREDYSVEDMPMPDFDGLSLEAYNKSMLQNTVILPYQISRGCTNNCSFCSVRGLRKGIEYKSYEKVLRELNIMKRKYNSATFHFCDDCINNSYEYLEGLCSAFINNKLSINWSSYAKINNLDKDLLRKMKGSGCVMLSFGIESGSNNMLKAMRKGFTCEQASGVLKDVYEAGIAIWGLFIAGYPYETKYDVKQTVEFIRKNNKFVYYLASNIFMLFYGSPIYLSPDAHKIKNLRPFYWNHMFAFDESNGLEWKQKRRQQIKSKRIILYRFYKIIELEKRHKGIKLFFAKSISNLHYLLDSIMTFINA